MTTESSKNVKILCKNLSKLIQSHHFFLFKGSYGIVKLAYNKDDDVQYVREYLFILFLIFFFNYKNNFTKFFTSRQ